MNDETSSDVVTLADILRWIHPMRNLLLLAAAIGALGLGATRIMRSRRFTVVTTLVPQPRQAPNSVGGLAAQLGLSLPQSDPAQSPQFYAQFVQSADFARQLAAYRDSSASSPDLQG